MVEVSRRVPHPLYKRIVNKRKKFYAHDEEGTAQAGRRGAHRRVPSAEQAEAVAAGGRGAAGGAGGRGSRRIWTSRLGAGKRAGQGAAARRQRVNGDKFMIGMRTILEVADNSGARRLSCILPRGGDLGLRAGLGDVVTASVKEAAPDSAIKKGKVVRCVIVRMRKETRRKDGTYIRFDSNAAVLINEVGEPVGTRVFGPVARELRDKKFMKIVSLAPEVI